MRHRLLRRALFGLLALVLVFSTFSVIIVKSMYDAQFVRFDRPDETTSADLRYEDIAAEHPRELGGGADSYLPQIAYFLSQGWSVFAYDATGCYDSGGSLSLILKNQLS